MGQGKQQVRTQSPDHKDRKTGRYLESNLILNPWCHLSVFPLVAFCLQLFRGNSEGEIQIKLQQGRY